MNCKPGQMAQITRTIPSEMHRANCMRDLLGRIVTVVSVSHTHDTLGAIWNIETPFMCPHSNVCRFERIPDAILTPIDPPQEGAGVDETIETAMGALT